MTGRTIVMKRRLIILLLACAGFAVQAARPPNVVFFLIDDLNHYGLSAYGTEKVSSTQGYFTNAVLSTPRIDSLAETGLRCDQAFVTPLCESTRVALMTGMHNGRNFPECKALHASQITFGDVFNRAGYATGMYGKWKQTRGTPSVPGDVYISEFGWDDYLCFDVSGSAKGWRRYIDPTVYRNGVQEHYTREDRDPETGRRAYGPDLCNRAALKFIEDHRNEPFLLYYPMILVHDEHTPTPDTQPANLYDEFDTETKSQFGHSKGDDRRFFPDMLAYMDKMVGNVLDKLDELNLRERTLVVIMGDNGAKECFSFTLDDGSVRQGGKGHNRDKGEHVSLIFSLPGVVPAGSAGAMRTYDGLFDVVDMYPTLLDACGISIPNADRIDGISAWPQVTGRKWEDHRKALYRWYNANRGHRNLDQAVAFAQSAKYKRYAPHSIYPEGRFFDLQSDPDEVAGAKGPNISWGNYHYAGLDVGQLSAEQRVAYEMLGEVLEVNNKVAVEGLELVGEISSIEVGGRRTLSCRIEPANATCNNLVWESSDPSVVSVDKFGALTTHAPGRATITVYSWDDAWPVANSRKPEYRMDGIKDTVVVEVQD